MSKSKQGVSGEITGFDVLQCTRSGCGLRYSVTTGDLKGSRCPRCRAPAEVVISGYNRLPVQPQPAPAPGPELEVLLDNIRSAWNVGSMLRSADGAGVRAVHLCGVSALPTNPKVAKTSLGAELSLPWRYAPDAVAAARDQLRLGMRLWALEGGERAVSLFDLAAELQGPPVVLAVGNELTGVDPGLLDLCERVVCLPMQGTKESLNVAVAFGIAVYTIRFTAAGADNKRAVS
jgi:tRNA G18 (ribose-2'-O)-methylase SpoU